MRKSFSTSVDSLTLVKSKLMKLAWILLVDASYESLNLFASLISNMSSATVAASFNSYNYLNAGNVYKYVLMAFLVVLSVKFLILILSLALVDLQLKWYKYFTISFDISNTVYHSVLMLLEALINGERTRKLRLHDGVSMSFTCSICTIEQDASNFELSFRQISHLKRIHLYSAFELAMECCGCLQQTVEPSSLPPTSENISPRYNFVLADGDGK